MSKHKCQTRSGPPSTQCTFHADLFWVTVKAASANIPCDIRIFGSEKADGLQSLYQMTCSYRAYLGKICNEIRTRLLYLISFTGSLILFFIS